MRGAAAPGKYLVIVIILALAIAAAWPAPSWARTEARYELRSGDLTFGNDLYSSNSQQSLFHQQTLRSFDNESLNIDFPPFVSTPAGNTVLGPTNADGGGASVYGTIAMGAGSSANILPFGQVNLAFPSISQTIDEGYSASSTGFYTASFLGIPPVNYGAPPVTTDYWAKDSVSQPPLAVWTQMFPEMVNIIPGYNRNESISKELKAQAGNASNETGTANVTSGNLSLTKYSDNASGPISLNSPGLTQKYQVGDEPGGQDNVTPSDEEYTIIPGGNATGNESVSNNPSAGTDETIAGQEILGAERAVPLNATGGNAIMYRLSYPYFNFKAKSNIIGVTSLEDRMWRNSHLGTMGRAYEGDTSYPDWILPTQYTKSAIAMADWYQVNRDALNYTIPGTYLTPRFWSLGITSQNNIGLTTVLDKLSILENRGQNAAENRMGTSGSSKAKTGGKHRMKPLFRVATQA